MKPRSIEKAKKKTVKREREKPKSKKKTQIRKGCTSSGSMGNLSAFRFFRVFAFRDFSFSFSAFSFYCVFIFRFFASNASFLISEHTYLHTHLPWNPGTKIFEQGKRSKFLVGDLIRWSRRIYVWHRLKILLWNYQQHLSRKLKMKWSEMRIQGTPPQNHGGTYVLNQACITQLSPRIDCLRVAKMF